MPFVRLLVLGVAKTLSKLFGLATVTFFGRMPSRDDDRMALVGVLSLVWLAAVVAVLVPAVVGVLPLAPEDEQPRRWLALAAVAALPLVNGWVVSRLHNRAGTWRDRLTQLAAAYAHTAAIGGIVVGLVVVAPLTRLRYLLRRFETQHLLVMIPEERADEVLDQVVELLSEHDAPPEVVRPNPVLQGMFRGLSFVVGHIFRRDIARRMRILRGELGDGGVYEITLHATDVTIIGRDRETTTLLPLLADELDERLVYFTWDDDSQRIEDDMRELRERLEAGEEVDPQAVTELGDRVRGLGLDAEEWGALRRNLLRLERDCLRRLVPDDDGRVRAR